MKHDFHGYMRGGLWMWTCLKCGSIRPVRLPVSMDALPDIQRRLGRLNDCKVGRRGRRKSAAVATADAKRAQ